MANNVPPLLNLIDGRLREAERVLEVRNPSTLGVAGTCALAGPDELEQGVEAAARAFAGWSQTSADARQEVLCELARRILESGQEIAALLTAEQGKPLAKALAEVQRGAAALEKIAAFRAKPESFVRDDRARAELHWRALGVCAAILPWNAPVELGLVKLANALITGNTLVWKPSPLTPLSTLAVARLAVDCIPAGVLNVMAGDDDLGKALVSHPLVRRISFTGSVPVGKLIQASAAQTLKRVTLELGGNDAAVILADADIPLAARMLVLMGFGTTGQYCAAPKRIYVHAVVKQALVDAMGKELSNYRIGDGFDPASDLGPVQNEAQYHRLKALRSEALGSGAVVLAEGAAPDGPGYFLPLTLFDVTDETIALVREEQFGPFLPIMTFTELDDAIARANGTEYGLGASVWSGDIDLAYPLRDRFDVGNFWVNQHGALDVMLPFPFAKQSGIGIDHGTHGSYEYLQPTFVSVGNQALAR